MKIRISSTVLAVLFLLLQLASCSAGKAYDNGFGVTWDDEFYYDKLESVPEMEIPSYGLNSSPTESSPIKDSSAQGGQNDLSNRKIIRTANLSFQTKAYDDFMSALEACIFASGGYIESSESHGGGVYQTNYSRSAYITVRVPESSYNSFMSAVGNLGSITHKSEDTTDVTIAYVDTESRIKALEAEYDALLAILEKATKLDDVIQLQSRISEVTYQLESHKSQLRKYDDLISYCTVNISVSEVYKEIKNEERMTLGERISEGFSETIEDMGEGLGDFTVWFISSIPYIVIWAIIIIVGVIIIKRSVKKCKAKKVTKEEKTEENEKDKEII